MDGYGKVLTYNDLRSEDLGIGLLGCSFGIGLKWKKHVNIVVIMPIFLKHLQTVGQRVEARTVKVTTIP